MGDENENLFEPFFEPIEMNYRNDIECATTEDTLQRLEAYWWHLYGMKQHRADTECGGKVTYRWPGTDLPPVDMTGFAINALGMQPCIDYLARMVDDAFWWAIVGRLSEPAEGVCSVGDSKGGRTECCQQNSSQA